MTADVPETLLLLRNNLTTACNDIDQYLTEVESGFRLRDVRGVVERL